MPKKSDLLSAFDKARRASEMRARVYGLIGKTSSDTPAECVVAARPTFLYVRVSGGGGVTIARNPGHVVVRANTPVTMIREGGNLVIIGYDFSGSGFEVATGGDTLNQYGVPPHTHRIGSGLEYEVESLRLEPGRVYCNTHDLIAAINGFRHSGGTFLSDTLDLSSYIPSAGNHRFLLVGVDMPTNTAVAIAGAEVTIATTLTLEDLEGLLYPGLIPLGAFTLADDTTELPAAAEVREWLNPAPILFDDSAGNPAAVVTTTAADGSSEFAARLDHVHPLADDSVTNAKLADMAAGTVKGRADGSGSGNPVDLTAAQLAAIVEPELSGPPVSNLDDLGDVLIVGTPDQFDWLGYGAGQWVKYPLETIFSQHTGNYYADWLSWPIKEPAHGNDLQNPGGGPTYPLGWTQSTAAAVSDFTEADSFWTLGNTSANTSWDFKIQSSVDIEAMATNAWKSFWIGPLIIKDGLYNGNVDYYFGIYASNGAGTAIDLTTYSRLHIQWDASLEIWQIRGEYKDGATPTDGAWYPLARHPLQPILARIAIKNDTNKNTVIYLGNNAFHRTHMPTLSGAMGATVAFQQAWWRFHMSRSVGDDDCIMIDSYDTSDDS
jgi:hypothetical protein